MSITYDSIIVGSGISGSTLAKELIQKGEKVLLIEKGGNHKYLGNPVSVIRIADRKGFRYTTGRKMVASGITRGGSSVLTAGTAFKPNGKMVFRDWNIDLTKELDEAEKETDSIILSDELTGKGNLHLVEAGNRLGYNWEKLPKFVDPEKCKQKCSKCMMGCPTGAKFTARNILLPIMNKENFSYQKKKIERVEFKGRKAIGVRPRRGHTIYGENIIIASGGIHSPIILQKSGIKEAGKQFNFDPMIFTYGVHKKKKYTNIRDIPMSVGTYSFYKEGMLISPVTDPWIMFLFSFGYQKRFWETLLFRHYPKLMGIMTKIQDEVSGTLESKRFSIKIDKQLSQQDYGRLNRGDELAREVLKEAGAKKFFTSPIRGAHPAGTNGIGRVVDNNLQVYDRENLYVCDASILPKSLGTPLVLILMAFGKRLAKNL